MIDWRKTARRIGLGRLALALWHRPVGRFRQSLRNGGPFAQRRTEFQRQEMEHAAEHLPPIPTGASAITLHLVSGRKFWYQTAFCLHSFAQAARVPIKVEIYDDGTCDDFVLSRLARLGPAIRFCSIDSTRERLERHLPRERFPVLRDRWDHYPNIRKLIDPHLGSVGWKLVTDSDLLFFRRPGFLLSWLRAPDRLLHATDCVESYGYTRRLLEHVAGASLPQQVNVGLCGLRSESLDWDELERWCATLIAAERTSYYLEQALVAMLAARASSCAIAPAADYVTMPARSEVVAPRAVMHHYVDTSKRWYFRYGWRHALATAALRSD